MSFGGTTALDFFRRGKLAEGERVLVNGASGAVGAAAVQLAKHFGAHVTGVCSTANLELVRSLGADAVIDYTKEDFTRSGATYDVIMDTVGTAAFSRSKGSLRAGGRLLLVLGGMGKYRPLIDRSYPLERAAEAHAHVDTGRKKGNVVLVVAT